jgi:hypothetical protein
MVTTVMVQAGEPPARIAAGDAMAERFEYSRDLQTEKRWAANTLRALGIVLITFFGFLVCQRLLVIAWIGWVVSTGDESTQNAKIVHAGAVNSFFPAILTTIVLVTVGILVIGKLAKEIILRPAHSKVLPSASEPAGGPAAAAAPRLPSVGSQSRHLPLGPLGHKAIERLVLAQVAQIAISAVMLFQLPTPRFIPHNWILMQLPPFTLRELPHAVLIYVLLKWPGRRSFTFLIAVLLLPIMEVLFRPMNLFYSGIHGVGLVWLVLSWLIYIATLVLAYGAIRQTGLCPKFSSVIAASAAMFFYFLFVWAVTPFLYSLWR